MQNTAARTPVSSVNLTAYDYFHSFKQDQVIHPSISVRFPDNYAH
jgi:hypothetical protein